MGGSRINGLHQLGVTPIKDATFKVPMKREPRVEIEKGVFSIDFKWVFGGRVQWRDVR